MPSRPQTGEPSLPLLRVSLCLSLHKVDLLASLLSRFALVPISPSCTLLFSVHPPLALVFDRRPSCVALFLLCLISSPLGLRAANALPLHET